MNNFDIVTIGIFIGIMSVFGFTTVGYIQKKRHFREMDLEITKVEKELLESIREIGLSNLQKTPAGKELYSLLSEKELMILSDIKLISRRRRVQFRPHKKRRKSPLEKKIQEALILTPYPYFLMILVSAISSIASILIIWIPFQSAFEYGWVIYPLLLFGLIGSVFFSLFIDNSFNMKKAGDFQRVALSAFTGIIGAWLGLLFIAFLIPVVVYVFIARSLPAGNQKG
jgi:hypothetical protein